MIHQRVARIRAKATRQNISQLGLIACELPIQSHTTYQA